MGLDDTSMNVQEISKAIQPAYTEFIRRSFVRRLPL